MSDTVPPTAAMGAVVLAGGTGERLGGVDKAGLELAGRRMLDRVLDAVATVGVHDTVVVGAVDADRAGVRVVVESPPRSGPAAGIVTGLASLGACRYVLVLACDLADPEPGVRALAAALHDDITTDTTGTTHTATAIDTGAPDLDGLCVGDADGRPQWLFGVYRREALDRAAAALGPASNRSVRRLMAPLRLRTLADTGVSGDDIDTWDAHACWSARLQQPPA